MITRDWACVLSLSGVDPAWIVLGTHLGHGVMYRHFQTGPVEYTLQSGSAVRGRLDGPLVANSIRSVSSNVMPAGRVRTLSPRGRDGCATVGGVVLAIQFRRCIRHSLLTRLGDRQDNEMKE